MSSLFESSLVGVFLNESLGALCYVPHCYALYFRLYTLDSREEFSQVYNLPSPQFTILKLMMRLVLGRNEREITTLYTVCVFICKTGEA